MGLGGLLLSVNGALWIIVGKSGEKLNLATLGTKLQNYGSVL